MLKNNLIRIYIFLLALWLFASAMYNANWVYRAVFITTMVVCLLAIWISKWKFGMDKILYLKAYIFTGCWPDMAEIAMIHGGADETVSVVDARRFASGPCIRCT